MKRKLLFAIVALLCSIGAWAVTGSQITATMTDVFLYNVESAQYLTAGDWWGTHATIGTAGMDLDLTKISDGVYTIQTRQNNGGDTSKGRYMSGVWMDSNSSMNFTFTEVDTENHYYTISYDDSGTKYLYSTDDSTVEGGTSVDGSAYYWQVVTRADFISSLSGATNANPKDATGAIYNAGFFVFDYATVKNADFPTTRSWQGTKLTDTWGYRANQIGNDGSNYCVEQFGKEFDNYQALTGMPNGKYVVKNQGFYKGDNIGYLYANDQQVALTKITDNPDAPEGYDGNALQKASYAFGKEDLYHNTTPAVIVTDGNLRIGTKATNNTDTWYCFDNFTLEYYGNAVEVYSPTAFDGDETVTASAWYAFTVASAGVYKITSTAAATISYTQDASDDADEVSTMNIAASGLVLKNFSAGTFYFKSSAGSTITITAATDGTDITSMMSNAAVASTTGWTNGATASGQKYTDAPDNFYLDSNSGEKNMSQDVNLPAGYYLMKCATRASTTANANVYVYSYETSDNVGIANNHKEGNSGNLLENGWAWTYVPFTLAADCKVGIGFYSNCSSTWAGADDFHLTYYTSELAMKQGHLAQVVADANAWGDKVTTTIALETALAASAPSCSTVSECNTAISNLTTTIANARASEVAYADFVRVKAGADAMALVANTNPTATTTLTSASSAQSSAAEAATTLAGVNTAISTLRTAIKTFISSAEPSNDGEYFDITCLMANPDFATGDASGWTYDSAPGVNGSNCEYYQTEFDINQTVTGLPTGSYSLNVQAFQRPGEASTVYTAYTGGTDNATSVLYINSITSKVKNIAADAQTSYKLGDGISFDWPNDSRVGSEGSYKYVPNSQQGAKLYFDAGLYDATCAAVVTDADEGSLKLGFKSTTDHVSLDWTIFDNFRLRYYGSSLFIYYKQYLPQLEEEVDNDYLSNGAYSVLQEGQTEREELENANATDVDELNTEEELQGAINDITTARDNFIAAKDAYDGLNTSLAAAKAITENEDNIGEGVFQRNSSSIDALGTAYTSAKGMYDTGTESKSEVLSATSTLNTAITAAETLNAPDAGKRYVLTIVEAGKAWNGNAVTFREGAANSDEGNFGIKYQTTTNTDYNQAIKFTSVSGNKYKLSVIRADGTEMYMTTEKLGYNKDGGSYGDERIRMTSDASKALEVEIRATSTDNQFQLYNSTAPGYIANNNNDDMYTANSCNFTIAEASQASVTVSAKAGKYGTVIFPFKPDVSGSAFDNIIFYSCSGVNDVTNNVQLEEVSEPVANVPYLIKNAGSDLSETLTGWGAAYQDSYTDTEGLLTGVYTDASVTCNANNYILQTQEGNQAFYLVQDEDFTATAYKCYLTYSSGGSVKSFGFEFNGETSINAIDNGQSTIDNTAIYNLAGQKVKKAAKGIYIVNGKKVVIK